MYIPMYIHLCTYTVLLIYVDGVDSTAIGFCQDVKVGNDSAWLSAVERRVYETTYNNTYEQTYIVARP